MKIKISTDMTSLVFALILLSSSELLSAARLPVRGRNKGRPKPYVTFDSNWTPDFINPLPESVPLYGKFEACFHLPRAYANPFDITQIHVTAEFTSPSGSDLIDGFYYQNYTRSHVGGREVLTGEGRPTWCLRYTPTHPQPHTVAFTAKDSHSQNISQKYSFQVGQAENPAGFIRLSPNNVHFEYDNTSTYFPIGENVCWVSEQNGTYDYDKYFGAMYAHGMNYARLWLTDKEWDDLAVQVGILNYSLSNTWRLDYVVSLAEQLKIGLLMCTESFNYFCTWHGPCDWNKTYYNKAHGGMLDRPQDFFTNEQAKNDYKQRLRYLVARYGYSTSVFAWEYFNEVDITNSYKSSDQVAWVKEMSSFLRTTDPYHHMITTSFAHSDGDAAVQALEEMSFTMTHNYGSKDIAKDTASYPYKKQQTYKKQSYVAEFGVDQNSKADQQGLSLHNGAWAPLFRMAAGTCMTWWWDSYVHPHNFYHIYDGLSQFVKTAQWSHYKWQPLQLSTSITQLQVYGMSGEPNGGGAAIAVLWMQDSCMTWSEAAKGSHCSTRDNVVLTSTCVENNSLAFSWISTESGKKTSTTSANCDQGKVHVSVPSFSGDIACLVSGKMEYLGGGCKPGSQAWTLGIRTVVAYLKISFT